MENSLEYLEKIKGNRYEAVIIASKYARVLNDRLRREKLFEKSEEGKNKEVLTDGKVTTQALKALVEGMIRYEKPENQQKEKH